MIGPEVSSSDGSTAIGGDNNAPVVNVNADKGAAVQLTINQHLERRLPSFLAKVIVIFAQQGLSQYVEGQPGTLPPEVIDKLKHNNIASNQGLFADYLKHFHVLEKSYLGVEQHNPDARYLVHRKARIAYGDQLTEACKKATFPDSKRSEFATKNAALLIDGVIRQLLHDYTYSQGIMVEQEIAHLAISLIVADAVCRCEVLERPHYVVTT